MLKTPAIFAICIAASIPAPISAQNREAEAPYYESGQWTVKDIYRSFCTLEHPGDEAGSLRISKSNTESAFFTFTLNSAKDYYTPSEGIVWLFDDIPVPGRILAGKHYQVRESTPDVEAAFRRAHTLTIRHDDETVARIDLKGSAAAFRKVKECGDRYPGKSVPTIPAPAPPVTLKPRVPAPRLDGPLPPNREVTPITPSKWITELDWQQMPSLPYAVPRVVAFTADVNELGRVTRCVVTEGSGVGQIDELTCNLITRRARFEPQTDASGKAVPAQFSTTVRWQVPE